MATVPPRRLSARRGSVSAPDPFAQHAELNERAPRDSFSTLTIVRVPSHEQHVQPGTTISLQDPSAQRRYNRRISSGNGAGRSDHQGPPSPRMSFAFNSFSSGSQKPGPPKSPTTSPRLGPVSPGLGRHNRGSSFSGKGYQQRLSPEQLYDLAKRSASPQLSPNGAATSSPYSNSGRSPSFSPALSPSSPGGEQHTSPPSFTPVPPTVYLPFVDRPSEVAALVSTPPTERLFALLKQMFPKRRPSSTSSSKLAPVNGSPESSHSSLVPSSFPHLDDLPSDPTQWSYSELYSFLTTAPRYNVSDAMYVKKLRKAIMARSELIWERVRGALGVPDEMNDDEFDEAADAEAMYDSDEAPSSSDLEDSGMKAKGHWDGWDAVMDSPVLEKRLSWGLSRPSSGVRVASPLEIPGDSWASEVHGNLESHFAEKEDRQKTLMPPATGSDGDGGDTTVSPTPVGLGSPGNKATLAPTSEVPILTPCSPFGITIEAVLPAATSPAGSGMTPGSLSSVGSMSISPNPPPLSLPVSLNEASSLGSGLGNIAEGEEEEEENADFSKEASTSPKSSPSLPVQGLRISTRSPSMASATEDGSLSRSSSPSTRRPSRTNEEKRRSFGYSSDTDEYTYNPMADRGPGNPLFPSNFARLALGPTLVANNPSLRSAAPLPQPRYIPGGSTQGIHQGHYTQHYNHFPLRRSYSNSSTYSDHGPPGSVPKRGAQAGFMALRGMRTPVSETGSNDYAVTIASGSSVGGD